MQRVLRSWVALIPVLLALTVSVFVTREWVRGASVFGVPLTPPYDVDTWTKVLGFTFGIPAGLLALLTYVQGVGDQQRANLWKRREYLAARFDRLEASDNCKAVMRILDYNATYVALPGMEGQAVSDQLLISALAPRKKRGVYTAQEQIIRDAFDTFLGELDRLAAMAAVDLVGLGDLEPFTAYWLRLFDPAERGRPAAYGAVLRRYVRVFGFNHLGRMLQDLDLMAFSGPKAEDEANADDALIAALDPTW